MANFRLVSLYSQLTQWIMCRMSLQTILKHLSYFSEARQKFQRTALTIQYNNKNFAPLWETFSCLHYSFSLVT